MNKVIIIIISLFNKLLGDKLVSKAKEMALSYAFEKVEPIIRGLLLGIFILSFSLISLIVGVLLILIMAIIDSGGAITYGALLLGVIIIAITSIIISFVIRFIAQQKIKSTQESIIKEL